VNPIAANALRLARLTAAGFLLLAAATFHWGFLRADELAARPDNLRRVAFDRRIQRGRILDRRGRVLAETREVPVADGDTAGAGDAAADAAESTGGGESAAGAPTTRRVRVYPVPAAAPVVGFQAWRYGAGGDARVTYGIGGAEAAYDEALRGDLGLSYRQLIAARVLHRPQAGHSVVLALDADLQAFAAEQLGGREGAVVVVDTGSGAVRALVSQPTFDPASLDEGPPAADDPRRPLFNRATQGRYPPGSIWKTVTLAAALNERKVALSDEVEDGDGVGYFQGFAVRCDNNPPDRTKFDIAHAFGWSCNLTFARLGVALGDRTYRQYAEAFGLEDAPPFPLPVAAGSLSSHDALAAPELASAAFGQGEILVTPMHMALVAAAAAGDGRLPVPYLLEDVPGVRWGRIADERGTWRRAVPEETAALVRQAMVIGAREGWARAAQDAAGVAIGGKTGTAQLGGDARPHAWFIGFAPAEAPIVAVAVLVVNGGEGARVAAPIGGRVLARAVRGGE